MLYRTFVAALLALLILPVDFRAADGDQVDFTRDIQPLLAENCYSCHGPDAGQRQAELRLDTKDGALAAHEGRVAVKPGKPDESELVRRIFASDAAERMPPADSNRKLTDAQRATLRRWVEQGAPWAKHWSLVPPKRPELPAVSRKDWVRNAIDPFVLARLEKEGLTPSDATAKEKLIRRVTLDLTGLPPTLAEVDAFLADASPEAYEKVVDRLLASPRFGERMVLDWLDAARYADSNGYQEDRTRTMWPWRDWVIEALNTNMPFDKFTIEQLAGDLLPEATRNQKLATGFHRNHMLNGEGGRIAEESRIDYVVDRVDTTATVWLGLTLACSRCHDHKFDPFTQKEYYQLFAFFNNVPESGSVDKGGNAAPVMRVMTRNDEQRLAGLDAKVAAAQAKLDAALGGIDAGQVEWEKLAAGEPAKFQPLRPTAAKSREKVPLQTLDDDSLLAGAEPKPLSDVYEVTYRTDAKDLRAIQLQMLKHDSLPHGGPGRAVENGNFVLATLEGEAVSVADPKQSRPIVFAAAYADFIQNPTHHPSTSFDSDAKTGWAVMGAPKQDMLTATFLLKSQIGFEGGTEIRLRFKCDSGHPRHNLGRWRIAVTSGIALSKELSDILAIPVEKRTNDQKAKLSDFYRQSYVPEYQALNDALAAAKKERTDAEAKLPESMVMEDSKPRDTHVLIRGAWDKPGEKVTAGVPATLPPLTGEGAKDRLALARWIIDPQHPLTARVAVNRIWQIYFGVGLVKTAEDFGVQGERPTHPELLDYLASEFVASGWNVKALHRLIVTSATYRQSSKATPQLVERDPDNRLYARGPRHRLSSFMIRDQALAASGLLVEKLGGPPVRPYQPPGVWEEFSFGRIQYEPGKGDDLYRRSLYTFWRRTVGPPTLFDTASRQVCTVTQTRTNTPLQPLVLLNETGFVEAARMLGQRMLAEGGAKDEERLTLGFRLVTSRKPTDKEVAVLTAALARLKSQFAADLPAAKKLLSIGEKKRDEKYDAAELAAYASVGAMLLNLDEALTKE